MKNKKCNIISIGDFGANVLSLYNNNNLYNSELIVANKKELNLTISNADITFFIIELGEIGNSDSIPIFLEQIKKQKTFIFSIVSKPFAWEGEKRKTIATKSFEQVIKQSDFTILIDKEKIAESVNEETLLKELFEWINDFIIKLINILLSKLHSTACINIMEELNQIFTHKYDLEKSYVLVDIQDIKKD